MLSGKYLFLMMIGFYLNTQAQSNYILHPVCNNVSNKPLVVFFTGDGGRSAFDKKIEDSLCVNNVPFMGINSYKYFRKRKTPQQTLDSFLPYIDYDLKKYHLQKVILAGYSFGSWYSSSCSRTHPVQRDAIGGPASVMYAQS